MNFGILLAGSVLVIWGICLFFGLLGGLAKTFKDAPSPSSVGANTEREEQAIQDINDKQRQVMDDMKQKIEDARQMGNP